MRTRIGLVAVGGPDWMGGLYYIHNLIKALNCLPSDQRPYIAMLVPEQHMQKSYHQDILMLVDEVQVLPSRYRRLTPDWLRFHLTHRRNGIYIKPYVLQEAAKKANVDVVFPIMDTLGTVFRVPWVAWIPDLQHKYYPENFDAREIRERDTLYPRMIRESAHIVMSSYAARSDLERFFEVSGEKVSVLQFRSFIEEKWFSEDPDDVVSRYNLPDKFILIANQFWKHKNHSVAFEALRIAARELHDVALVCTGSPKDSKQNEANY